MEKITETIKDFLESNGYKIVEIDEDGIITIRFQMNIVHICPNKGHPEFLSLMIPNVDEVDEENPLTVMLACMRVVSQQMVVKAFPIGKDNVALAYEFFFSGEDELKYQIEKGLDALMSTKSFYRKCKSEIEEE